MAIGLLKFPFDVGLFPAGHKGGLIRLFITAASRHRPSRPPRVAGARWPSWLNRLFAGACGLRPSLTGSSAGECGHPLERRISGSCNGNLQDSSHLALRENL